MSAETESILIIDDHPVVLQGLESMLQDFRPKAIFSTASNAKQALEYIDKNESYDWIFIDFNLPDINGIELLKNLRENKVMSNIIMISSDLLIEKVEAVLKLNPNGIISKGFDRKKIIECFNTIENGDVFLSDEHANELQYYRQSQLYEKNYIIETIGDRQIEVLLMISKGYSNDEIAKNLGVTISTVKYHISALMQLFDADNRTHCVSEAKRLKIIE